MAVEYEVTSAGLSPAKDRAHRIRVYFIAMSVRVLCVLSLFWVRGWWIALVAAGAVLLPYFAVLIANQAAGPGTGAPEAPSPLGLPPGESSAPASPTVAETLIVVERPFELGSRGDTR